MHRLLPARLANHSAREIERDWNMVEPSYATVPESFAVMQSAFQPSRAVGVDKRIQFDFTGRESGTWAVAVRTGAFEYHEGPAQSPNATVTVDSDIWLAILRSEITPLDSVMSGKLQIEGDMGLMIQFQNWFDPSRGA